MKPTKKKSSSGAGIKQEYSFGVEENWIDVFDPSDVKDCTHLEVQGGTVIVFADRQERIQSGSQARYTHYCEKILNQSGVNEASIAQINFIPEIQYIVIHKMNIIRNGAFVDKTSTSHFRIKQSERFQGEQKYQGYKTLTIFIDGIQVHDEVEVSYTLFGSDPAAKEHLATRLNTTSDTMGFYRYKVILPCNKKLYYRNFKTTIEPTIRSFPDKDYQEYCWAFQPGEILPYEPSTPLWYEFRPYIEISTYENWSEVVEIFISYYNNQEPIPKPLKEVLKGITAQFDTPLERIAACLDFTQNSIRYLSLEEPHLTYRPGHLGDILKNGFGDCKDKTLVLITMLNYLNIEAFPALISATDVYQPEGCLPSFKWFDHVIVCVKSENQLFWLDATASNQAGSLKYRAQNNRGDALIIKSDQNGLTRLPIDNRGNYETKEVYDFTLGSAGPIKLTVVSKSYGRNAENLRLGLNEGSTASLSKQYLEFYGQHYKDIKSSNPLEIIDNLDENSITTTECYEIQDINSFNIEDDNLWIGAHQLRPYLDFPPNVKRLYPYLINHPLKAHYTLELYFMKPLLTPSETNTNIVDEAFKFTATDQTFKDKIISNYTYESLKDNILPERLEEYNENLHKAYQILGWSIHKDVIGGEWKDTGTSEEKKESWASKIFTYFLYSVVAIIVIKSIVGNFFKEDKRVKKSEIKISRESQVIGSNVNNTFEELRVKARLREEEKIKSILNKNKNKISDGKKVPS